MAKKRKINPNRFRQQDEKSLFAFDPTRQQVLKWGAIAGALGGLLMLQQSLLWQIAGVFVVVLVSNHHISRASQRIPRWQATVLSFIGVTVAIFGVVIVGTVITAYFRPAGG